jgi:hypothetical protein
MRPRTLAVRRVSDRSSALMNTLADVGPLRTRGCHVRARLLRLAHLDPCVHSSSGSQLVVPYFCTVSRGSYVLVALAVWDPLAIPYTI